MLPFRAAGGAIGPCFGVVKVLAREGIAAQQMTTGIGDGSSRVCANILFRPRFTEFGEFSCSAEPGRTRSQYLRACAMLRTATSPKWPLGAMAMRGLRPAFKRPPPQAESEGGTTSSQRGNALRVLRFTEYPTNAAARLASHRCVVNK